MATTPDVLILGGGVIGLTAAYYLTREGVSVAIVDRGDFGREASWAGAGIIPPGNPSRCLAPFERLRALSSAMFADLSQELKTATGMDNAYYVCGGLEWLRQDEQAIVQAWRDEGLWFERVEGRRFQELQPTLSITKEHAYFLPEMAQVRNPRHLRALLGWCEGRVRLWPHEGVRGFEGRGERVISATSETRRIEAKQFLIAAGAWSDELLQTVSVRPGIRPIRGQIVLLNTGKPLLQHILIQGKRYIVPRDDGRVLVGSTEEDVGFEKRTTATAIEDLLAFGRGLVPALAKADVERCWAGLRPGSPDGMPFLGRVPGIDNLFVAAGHFRSGIQLSPATGLVLSELIVGKTPSVALEAFALDRQPSPARQTTFRS